jgi:hypothetical protein
MSTFQQAAIHPAKKKLSQFSNFFLRLASERPRPRKLQGNDG